MPPAMYLARVDGLVARTARALWERHVERADGGPAGDEPGDEVQDHEYDADTGGQHDVEPDEGDA
jgi:hypothetical protein